MAPKRIPYKKIMKVNSSVGGVNPWIKCNTQGCKMRLGVFSDVVDTSKDGS